MTQKDLQSLDKEELLKIIDDLEKENKDLKSKLAMFDNENTPSSKKYKSNSKQKSYSKTRFPGKPKGKHGAGIKMPEVTSIEDHKLECCPHCNSQNIQEIGFFTKKVLDIPKNMVRCVEHRFHNYKCECSKNIISQKEKIPFGHYGPNIKSASTILKSAGLSFGAIANFWKEVGFKSISASGVLGFTNQASQKLKSVRGRILQGAKLSKVAHKDETGLRKDGKNGYTWGLFTQRHAIFEVATSRSMEVAEKIRGKHQISVTDAYAGYNKDENRQLCWAHLLRKAKKTAGEYPETQDQVNRLFGIFRKIKIWIEDPPNDKRIDFVRFELDDVANILRSRRGGKHLRTYLENGGDNWITALKYTADVPLTNNHAERMIRKIVVLRKNMGCYRNDKGKDFIDITMSAIMTWKLRNLNVYRHLNAYLT